jgi:hypothetical protein
VREVDIQCVYRGIVQRLTAGSRRDEVPTMRDLSFFVDVVTTGRILGVDAACTPEEATDALGEYAEKCQDKPMIV